MKHPRRCFSGLRLHIWIFLLLLLSGCVRADKQITAPEPPATVMLEGQDYALDTTELTLITGDVGEEELQEALSRLDALTRLEYPDCPLDVDAQLRLLEEFPGVQFIWPVNWEGQSLPNDTKTLDAAAYSGSVAGLCRLLSLFPSLQSVELGDRLLSKEEAEMLRDCSPGTEFHYTAELFGQLYDSRVEEIDLSHIEMEDTEAVEAALVHFSQLKKVYMHYCGLDNETMDALNCRYEDIRFVWTVQVLDREVPTDTTWFIRYTFPYTGNPACGAENLCYCPDIVALDLGHTMTPASQMGFLEELTKLRYLILGDTYIDDLSPLSHMPELEYLEIFGAPVEDLSPLLDCPKLVDLNIVCCGHLDMNAVEVLLQMPQLERLWCSSIGIASSMKLKYPDCLVACVEPDDVVSFGWREHPRYFAMRDALHMYYMK